MLNPIAVFSELRTLSDPAESRAQFFGTWRVALALVTVEIVGGAIGLYAKPFPDWFLSLWVGGALAAFPGFVLGLFWHRSVVGGSIGSFRPIILFYGLFAFVLTAVAWPMATLQAAARAVAV
jgi:hypothetical protein